MPRTENISLEAKGIYEDGWKKADDVVAVVVVDSKVLVRHPPQSHHTFNDKMRSTNWKEILSIFRWLSLSLLVVVVFVSFCHRRFRNWKKAKVFHCWCRPRLYREPWKWKENNCVCVRGVRRSWSQQCVNPIWFYDFISAIPFFVASAKTRKSLFTPFLKPPTPHSRATIFIELRLNS